MDFSGVTEKIKSLPTKQKILGSVLGAAVVGGLLVWYVFLPKTADISSLEQEVAELNNQIGINRTKAIRLAELKRENDRLQHELALLKEQLPPEAEVEILLKQVSDLGIRTGLDFKLWRPSDRKQSKDGLYTEVPVTVEVSGGYHALGAFFDKVSKLPRIINVSDIRMGSSKIEKEKLSIQTNFIATAFAATSDKPSAPPPKEAKKP